MNSRVYKFEDFLLDPKQRKLLLRDRNVKLSSRAFEMLLLLVRRQGEVVEKDELLAAVWRDAFVEESNLVVHISALRRILGEKRGERKFIETISGRGYSFVFPVAQIDDAQNPAAGEATRSGGLKSEKNQFHTSVSLAVLPFSYQSGNADFAYLASGITQSLIENLSQIPKLKVMAYSAVETYRRANVDLQEAGFLLGVEKLLHGRIAEYKDNLEISVELINAEDKSYIWGTRYDCKFTDIFEVRNKISLVIAEKLQLRLNNLDESNLARRQTSNSDAYKLYLKGAYLLGSNSTSKFRQESLHAALKCFSQALEKDAGYALAHTGIGYVYYRLFNINVVNRGEAYTNCKKALRFALECDPRLSEAYTLNGVIEFFFERDLAAAEKSFDRAIELNPNNSIAHHYKSVLLCCFERCEEAILYQNQAIQRDPVSIFLNNGLATRFFFTGDYAKAIIQAEETLELDGELLAPFFIRALAHAHTGNFAEARENARRAIEIQPIEEMFFAQAYVYALAGDATAADEIARRVLSASDAAQIDFTDAATVYAALKEKDEAFQYLEKALHKGDTNIVLLRTDPRFINLRDDARFDLLLQKLNLK